MLSDHKAQEVHFAGLGAQDASASAAGAALADALQQWASQHPEARIEQLSLSAFGANGALALLAYTDSPLPADPQEAVAAAVEEIHVAQQASITDVVETPPSV